VLPARNVVQFAYPSRSPVEVYVNLAGVSGHQVRAWQADGCGLNGDIARNGINREDDPAAGTMITKTFFLA
jgi:hypothetical protein